MEQTTEDKAFLRVERATLEDDKAESVKMVEMVNLLQGNLGKIRRLMWCQLLIIGVLIILLFITYFTLLSKIPSASNVAALRPKPLEKPSPTSEKTSTPQVTQSEPSVKSTNIPGREEVLVVLDQVRIAQLMKDINMLLRVYSPTYPNLGEKKESVMKSWQKYNYLDIKFNIENIQKENDHTIIAEVTCNIYLEDINSKKRSNLMKDYIITFSNVSGETLIQNVTQEKKAIEAGNKG